jgi:hypothetical protein
VTYPGFTPVGNATLVVANVLTCNKHSQKKRTRVSRISMCVSSPFSQPTRATQQTTEAPILTGYLAATLQSAGCFSQTFNPPTSDILVGDLSQQT